MKVLVDIYRSEKKEGLYLYVPNGYELAELPEALIKQFGRATKSMTIALTEEKKLARANAKEVLCQIEKNNYYLQMPPVLHTESSDDA